MGMIRAGWILMVLVLVAHLLAEMELKEVLILFGTLV